MHEARALMFFLTSTIYDDSALMFFLTSTQPVMTEP